MAIRPQAKRTSSALTGNQWTADEPRRHGAPQVIAAIVMALLVGSFLLLTVVKLAVGVPNASLPTLYAVGKGVAIFDRNNRYVCTVYADRDRMPVPLSQISPNVRLALLAAEDHNFYGHHGIDPIGIGRAFVSNLRAGHVVEGGSTITQQLVRNLYLNIDDRSFKRKFVEVVLSFDVENKYSKEKILETYLNEVYFGNGVYGIERAAQVYFNKHAHDLTLAESAFITGLIKAPSDLGAPVNRDAALARQNEVLDKMVLYKFISQQQATKAKTQKLHFVEGAKIATPYPYYVNFVLRELGTQMPQEQIWGKGLRVYTNLDPTAQKLAEETLNKGISRAPAGINQGALVSESVRDGAVIAMVGGVGDYRNHQWNRAVNPHTVGSSFKPFVYLAALINGALEPTSAIDDTPISFNMGFGHTYAPKNYDGRYLGRISARDALVLSRNVCSIRVADAVGIDNVIKTARAAGITAPLDKNLTIALGSCAVSPLEMATAYATLARDGMYMAPRLIRQVDDAQGQHIKIFAAASRQTLPAEQVSEIDDVLQDVVQRGTGTQARLAGIAVAGKTGTADKAKDIWFVGFTPDTVTAVWGGNDRYLPVRGNVTGGMVMAKIWHDYMQDYYKSHPAPKSGFVPPRTPLISGGTTAIPAGVLNDAAQYDEGVKQPSQDDTSAAQQEPADAQGDAVNVMPQPEPAQSERSGDQGATAGDGVRTYGTVLRPITEEQSRLENSPATPQTYAAPRENQQSPVERKAPQEPAPEPAETMPQPAPQRESTVRPPDRPSSPTVNEPAEPAVPVPAEPADRDGGAQ